MISKDRQVLQFGTGDILISIGATEGTATLIFRNKEAGPIGARAADGEDSSSYILQPSDVMMTFSCPESVDALIKSLRVACAVSFPEASIREA